MKGAYLKALNKNIKMIRPLQSKIIRKNTSKTSLRSIRTIWKKLGTTYETFLATKFRIKKNNINTTDLKNVLLSNKRSSDKFSSYFSSVVSQLEARIPVINFI